MIRTVLSLLLLLGAICSTFAKSKKYIPKEGKRTPLTLSRGWGDQLKWAQTYEEALFLSRKHTKPLLVIFHLEHCEFSQAMKKAFANNYEIQKILDEDFVVINLMYETTDKNLSQDGFYYPRFIFIDPSMTVRARIVGPYSNHFYTYEPKDIDLLLENIKKARILLNSEL